MDDDIELTEDQKYAMSLVNLGHNLFITGPGGSGKSFLIKYIKTHIKKKIYVTAMTGIASTLIDGETLHHWAGILTGEGDVHEVLFPLVANRSKPMMNWKTCEILIIDEISMMTAELFDKLCILANKLRRKPSDIKFGDIQLLVFGDFYQLEPVQSQLGLCFESKYWNKVIDYEIEMTQIVRQRDPVFKDVLCLIRKGILNSDGKYETMVVNSLGTRVIDKNKYKELISDSFEIKIKPTIIHTKNVDVDKVNKKQLMKLINKGSESRTYNATISIYSVNDKGITGKILAKEKDLSIPIIQAINIIMDNQRRGYSELTLAIGSQVMYTVNEDSSGLVNGSRGVVTSINPKTNYPIVKFINDIEMEVIPHGFESPLFDLKDSNGRKLILHFDEKTIIIRKQLPLILCDAITVHKSQGSTLDSAIINMNDLFCFGQGYVALSRVRDINSLYIIGPIRYDKIMADPLIAEFYNRLRKP